MNIKIGLDIYQVGSSINLYVSHNIENYFILFEIQYKCVIIDKIL